MKHLIIFIAFFYALLNFTACDSETEPYTIDNSGKEYFPLKAGATWIYKVDSIVFDYGGSVVDTTSNTVKEIVTGSFTDDEGVKNYTIERYNKTYYGWEFINTITASVTETKAIRNENNLRFIKMVFPIVKNKSWDGNAYFDSFNTIVKVAGEPIKMFQSWTYRYLDVDKGETIGDRTYDKVCTVQEVDYETDLQRRYSLVKYAKGIGTVYKKMIILNTQLLDSTDIPWEDKAEEGFLMEQTLLSYSGL